MKPILTALTIAASLTLSAMTANAAITPAETQTTQVNKKKKPVPDNEGHHKKLGQRPPQQGTQRRKAAPQKQVETPAQTVEIVEPEGIVVTDTQIEETPAAPVEDNTIYSIVEQPPSFPGGEAKLYKFIAENICYPPVAQENNIQGRVIVQFVVQKDGSIGQVKVARSVNPDLDKEAVRIVKKLPDFIPGKLNGQAVNVWYTLPVSFKLH